MVVVVVPPGWWCSLVCVIPVQEFRCLHVTFLLCEWGVLLFLLDLTSPVKPPLPAGKPQPAPLFPQLAPPVLFVAKPCAYVLKQ